MSLKTELAIAFIFAIAVLHIMEMPMCMMISVYQHNLTSSNQHCDDLCKLEIDKNEINEDIYLHGLGGDHLIVFKRSKDTTLPIKIKSLGVLNSVFELPISVELDDNFHIAKESVIPVIIKINDSYEDGQLINNSTLHFEWAGPNNDDDDDNNNNNNNIYYHWTVIETGQAPAVNKIRKSYNNFIDINCTDNRITECNYSFLVRACENGTLGPFSCRNISIDRW